MMNAVTTARLVVPDVAAAVKEIVTALVMVAAVALVVVAVITAVMGVLDAEIPAAVTVPGAATILAETPARDLVGAVLAAPERALELVLVHAQTLVLTALVRVLVTVTTAALLAAWRKPTITSVLTSI